MKDVAACGLFILLFDAVLCVAQRAELVLLECSNCGGLVGVWAFGAVKWVILRVFTSMLTEGKPEAVLSRLVALLSLLSPVFETGRMMMAPPSEPYIGPSHDLNMLLLSPMSSTLACVVWELGLRADRKMKRSNIKLDSRQLLMRMLNYFKPDTLYIVAAFSFLILGVVCDTFIPFYQGKVIDMLRGGVLQTSFCYAIGQLALVSLGSAVFSGLRGGIFMCSLARLNKRLKGLLFHTLLQQEVNFFDKNNSGSLSSRLESDVDRMGRTVALNANAMVRSTVKTCLMLGVMIQLSWELTLLTCIEMPLLAILQNKYNTLSMELKEKIQDCQAKNKVLASQAVKLVQTVRRFKAEKVELRKYNEALEQMCAVRTRKGIYSTTFCLMRRLVSLGIKLLMLSQARSLISSGRLTTGTIVSFFLYQKPMSNNLKEILYCYGDTMSTLGIISKVFGYLDRTPECKTAGELAPAELEGRIVFQNVTFTYPSAPNGTPALKSVSMEIEPGKMTALVGPSGGGKSSCVSLLLRLYEPQEGQILLDGEQLHHYEHKYFHQKMALVSQSPELFAGSLRYNIEYGLKDCTIEKVKEAVETAKANDLISQLEDYDTDIVKDGNRLSSGQQHCIAIIRALVRDPQVVVLDETTGKVDAEVWHSVLEDLLSRGRTVLVVAHKLKSVEKADKIIFLEEGEVMEEGTHQDLLAKGGRYYQFCQNTQ
uniref:antigen peptide transporter 2 n=1 Tax=Scatophagus argus TaxID=75038 RepID=UPI001ED80158|nr:antigen peptide transporter 2 [Scatophagus argus]XP_046233567.1 antigen peptide transporter 2 [Scatophagus argus]